MAIHDQRPFTESQKCTLWARKSIGSWQPREESSNSGQCEEVAVSLPFSQSLKLFQKKSSGRTRYENTERSSKGHEDCSWGRLEVRLFQGAMEDDTSLMTILNLLSSRYSLADCTMNLSVFHSIACLPPLSPVYMSNKLFHVPKLHLWIVFFPVSVLGKIFLKNLTNISGDYIALLL